MRGVGGRLRLEGVVVQVQAFSAKGPADAWVCALRDWRCVGTVFRCCNGMEFCFLGVFHLNVATCALYRIAVGGLGNVFIYTVFALPRVCV